jgi:hypothetical protein
MAMVILGGEEENLGVRKVQFPGEIAEMVGPSGRLKVAEMVHMKNASFT